MLTLKDRRKNKYPVACCVTVGVSRASLSDSLVICLCFGSFPMGNTNKSYTFHLFLHLFARTTNLCLFLFFGHKWSLSIKTLLVNYLFSLFLHLLWKMFKNKIQKVFKQNIALWSHKNGKFIHFSPHFDLLCHHNWLILFDNIDNICRLLFIYVWQFPRSSLEINNCFCVFIVSTKRQGLALIEWVIMHWSQQRAFVVYLHFYAA